MQDDNQKGECMKNKRISIQEAAEIVKDGSRLTFAGFTIWRKPFALAYELIRQQRRNLHLIEIGGGSISDCLIGAGCIDIYESCWVGHELYGKYGANLSRKVKNKEIIMEDYSHGEMVFRFAAAAAGMPFAVSQACLGTDLHNPEYDMLGRAGLRDGKKNPRSKYLYMEDPFFDGGKYVLLPAAKADVAVLSVQQAGEEGTVRIEGQYYSDPDCCSGGGYNRSPLPKRSCRKHICAAIHDQNTIPSFEVDYIVECPWNAHPAGMFGQYDVDGDFLRHFFQHTRTQEGFDAFAKEWIHGLDHNSYLEKLGVSRLQSLRANTALKYSTNRGKGEIIMGKKIDYAKPEEYGLADLLCCAASREVADNEIVFAGTGLPMVAILLAQKTHAPNLKLIFEAGTLDGRPPEIPTSVGDARCEVGSSVASGLYDAFSINQRGYVDLGYLGGAEVDEYGNVNTTVIGDYLDPELRLTGSGGNPDINSFAKRTVFIMLHEKRRFRAERQLHHESRLAAEKLALGRMGTQKGALRGAIPGRPFGCHQHAGCVPLRGGYRADVPGYLPPRHLRWNRSRNSASSIWMYPESREKPFLQRRMNYTSSTMCSILRRYSSRS